MVKLSLNKPLFNISNHFSCKSFRVSYTPASFFANFSTGHYSLDALCCGFVHSLSGLDFATIAVEWAEFSVCDENFHFCGAVCFVSTSHSASHRPALGQLGQ